MINSTDFRTGLTIEYDGGVWQIVDFQHVKPGKGAAFVRTKIKNVETGAVIERTFNPNEKMPAAHLETHTMQFLYEADGVYTFMNTETYEQSELTREQLGDALNYLMENMEVAMQQFKDRIIGIQLPNSVKPQGRRVRAERQGQYGDGGNEDGKGRDRLRGTRSSLINEGDVLRIDTRTGNYIERA